MKKIRNNKGFTLIELLVSMAVAGILMTVSFTIFETALRIRDNQELTKDIDGNARIALTYLKKDIEQTGAYLGDFGFFNWYSPISMTMNMQFCIDFELDTWPDYTQLLAAWQARFTGWTVEYGTEDIVQLWYGDADVYSKIKTANVTNLLNFDIEDDPIDAGFNLGDYILFYDSTKDATTDGDYVRGSPSKTNWLTVLTGIQQYVGDFTKGELKFDVDLPYTAYFRTPYTHNIVSLLPDKGQFLPPDRIYKIHRVVYGVMKKYVQGPSGTREVKMLIRDDFQDPTGVSRYNPLVIATNIEGFALTTVFKLPSNEAGNKAENLYNSIRLNYYDNTGYLNYGIKLKDALTADAQNDDLTDHDPRDIRKLQVEILTISSKRDAKFAASASGTIPPLYRTPPKGVVMYNPVYGLAPSVRYPGASSPDFFKHTKMVLEIGIRTLRMKDFAVSPE